MRRLNVILVLFSAAVLAACQAGSDSTSANGGTRPGASLRVPKPNSISAPRRNDPSPRARDGDLVGDEPVGDRVVARLAEDVRVGEKVVVPAGTEVRGRVTAAVPSGRVKTRARLAFDFDTLVLDGREHAIGTGPLDITAGDTHKKDAATIGIGAGAGAIVGAIANGKKGAAIGALIGGAAGTGVVLTNTGKQVELGSGSRVTVRLTHEARL